jgi:hypothetical protein
MFIAASPHGNCSVTETLLQRVLFLVDRIESPTISHATAIGYSAEALAKLVSNGILCNKFKAARIPRPARFGSGDDLIVRETSYGLFGVAEGDDFIDPLALEEDDRWLYEISLPHLVDAIRSENGINGAGFENDEGLIPLGTKVLERTRPAWVYLSLPNGEEQAVLARCARLRVPTARQRAFLLLPGSIAFSPEARRILADCKVEVLSLMESAATSSLALDWAITYAPIEASESASIFHKENEVWALSFDGKTVHLPNRSGMGYIAELLRRPHTAIEAATLIGAPIIDIQVTSRGIPLADRETLKQVRATLKAKQSELAGLGPNDWAKRGPLQDEIAKISTYLARVQDHKGQARKVAGSAQRSRTAVTTAVNRARDYISAQHPALGRHLKKSIKTGTLLVYAPSEVPDWQF